ncbi:hypothetical protein YB2330_004891 [Saitoella coloradoensis]
MPLSDSLEAALSNRKRASRLRRLSVSPLESSDFSSNDFLSLSTSERLHSIFLTELKKVAPRLGSGGSRLLDGNSTYAEDLESRIAEFHGAPTGLLFNSGYDANVGFFSCVPQKGDYVIYDALIHASVHDGFRASRIKAARVFKHNDVASLRFQLEKLRLEDPRVQSGEANVFIAVEALYSMDGDLSPLSDIITIMDAELPRGNAYLVLDEAHSTGVYGDHGCGWASLLTPQQQQRIYARLHTFGKALATNGAILLCREPILKEYLINYARPLIYSTAMSYPTLASITAVYNMLRHGETRPLQKHLHSLISTLSSLLGRLPSTPLLTLPSLPLQSPILPLITLHPRQLADVLQKQGFNVRAICWPTVEKDKERVRVCLHAGNKEEEVTALVKAVGRWVIEKEAEEMLRAKL